MLIMLTRTYMIMNASITSNISAMKNLESMYLLIKVQNSTIKTSITIPIFSVFYLTKISEKKNLTKKM
ncbi:hypothetical protein DB895_03785 [Flavobacterium psychrotolerans]|uniref:Uncharacterized protein n=1 Tax=Flavobacterium psychrotolerans TaxID=2169410 RepID=A0A2U1JN06_9FLAO|nr:hypothetical protein DB895_03785 [Flavobacterium psychrotolerans]